MTTYDSIVKIDYWLLGDAEMFHRRLELKSLLCAEDAWVLGVFFEIFDLEGFEGPV